MEYLNKKLVDNVCHQLWALEGSLKGLSGLFTQGYRDINFDGEEVYGIGLLLGKLSREVKVLELVLRNEYEDNDLGFRWGDPIKKEDEALDTMIKKLTPALERILKNKGETHERPKNKNDS